VLFKATEGSLSPIAGSGVVIDRNPAALQDDLEPAFPAPGKIGTLGTTPIYQSRGTKEEKRA
jgi:hypothetical protein